MCLDREKGNGSSGQDGSGCRAGVSWLVGVFSPVNHKGLHEGW